MNKKADETASRDRRKAEELEAEAEKINRDAHVGAKRKADGKSEYGALPILLATAILIVALLMLFGVWNIDPVLPTFASGILLVIFTALSLLPVGNGKTRPIRGVFGAMALVATAGTVLFGAWTIWS